MRPTVKAALVGVVALLAGGLFVQQGLGAAPPAPTIDSGASVSATSPGEAQAGQVDNGPAPSSGKPRDRGHEPEGKPGDRDDDGREGRDDDGREGRDDDGREGRDDADDDPGEVDQVNPHPQPVDDDDLGDDDDGDADDHDDGDDGGGDD